MARTQRKLYELFQLSSSKLRDPTHPFAPVNGIYVIHLPYFPRLRKTSTQLNVQGWNTHYGRPIIQYQNVYSMSKGPKFHYTFSWLYLALGVLQLNHVVSNAALIRFLEFQNWKVKSCSSLTIVNNLIVPRTFTSFHPQLVSFAEFTVYLLRELFVGNSVLLIFLENSFTPACHLRAKIFQCEINTNSI